MMEETQGAPEPAQGPEAHQPEEHTPEVEYILVALDTSPHSEAALAAAAQLAAALHLELRGLYVEDINLLRLCGTPFGVEYGSFTASPRRIEQHHLEREFRIQASLLRKIMADIAGQNRIAWSFQVVRGGVTDQLLEAATAARILSLGRVGRSPGKRTGSTAQSIARRAQRPVVFQSRQRTLHGPYSVLHTGSPAAYRALALGRELAAQEGSVLQVLAPNDELAAAAATFLASPPPLEPRARPGTEPGARSGTEPGARPGAEPGEMGGAVRAEAPSAPLGLPVPLPPPAAVYGRAETLRELLAAVTPLGVVILPVESAAWLDDIPLTVIVVP
jgi:nucleotide-binding universal stress UspA family protein